MPTADDADRTASRVRLLRCLRCGNTVECQPVELLRFAQTGWLKCCGEVMTLYRTADRPEKRPPTGS